MPQRSVRIDEGFGKRLREMMDQRGIKPGRMARDLGVGAGTVSRWRRGECPDDLRLPEIATYLRVPLEWLKTGIGDADPEAHTTRAPGRRAQDFEAQAALLRKDAARLDMLILLLQAYRETGMSADAVRVLVEYLEIASANPPPGSLDGPKAHPPGPEGDPAPP